MNISPLCNGSLTFIWETPSSLNGTPALSQGQEKETPVFLITSVEIPCKPDVDTQHPQLHMHPDCTLNTFGRSPDLLGLNYKSNPQPWMDEGAVVGLFHRRQKNSRVKWRWNGTDASASISYLSSNLRSEMYSMWSALGFPLSLTCYTAVSKVF